jgi:hypothetical protein
MEYYKHFDYGELLASSHISLSSEFYFKCSESDNLMSLTQRMSDVDGTVLVALDGKNSDFKDNNADQLTKRPQYFFMILTPSRSDDSDAILNAQDVCEKIALQIQAKMIFESNKYVNGLTCLEIDSFIIRGVGPIGDSLYGVIMGFNIPYGIEFKVDETVWK